MAPESVQCCTTSPPYWGLRDYGLPPTIWDGNKDCEHVWGDKIPRQQSNWHTFEHKYHSAGSHKTTIGSKMKDTNLTQNRGSGAYCQKCGAWLGCLGLEPTPELYVKHVVEIFREVKRVLRKDGTLWLNLGDTYSAGTRDYNSFRRDRAHVCVPKISEGCGLPPKNLVGIPWKLAFALQRDGWYLRQDIIWQKPNPMPESVTDR